MKTPHVERTTVDVLLVEAGARPEANVVAGDLVIEQAGRHDGRRTVPAVGELVGPDPTDDVFGSASRMVTVWPSRWGSGKPSTAALISAVRCWNRRRARTSTGAPSVAELAMKQNSILHNEGRFLTHSNGRYGELGIL